MLIRCVDGSYAPGGIYYESLRRELKPDFSHGINIWDIDIKSLAFVCGVSTAYEAHYNAPRFYDELRDNTMARFNVAVLSAFAFAVIINLWIMIAGYLTFGAATQTNILNNYADNDPMATFARLSVLFSILCGYPLVFSGVRENLLSSLGCDSTDALFYGSTCCVIPLIAFATCLIHSLSFVNNFAGALFSSTVMYVFPGACYLLAIRNDLVKSSLAESLLAKFLVCLGLAQVVIGSIVAFA